MVKHSDQVIALSRIIMLVLCFGHDLASGWLMIGAVLGTSLLYICLLVFRTSARLSTMAAVVCGLCWNQ